MCDFSGAGKDVPTCSILRDLYESAGGDDWLDNRGWGDAFSASSVGGPPADYCTFPGITCTAGGMVERVDFGFAGLAGTIPPSLGGLVSVTDLRMDVNQLSGVIPQSLCSLTNLHLLVLVSNRLSGTIPSCVGALTGLTLLRVDNNVLEGSLPSSLASLTNLMLLGLNNNRVAGSLPDAVGALTALQSLSAAGNVLQGTLPGPVLSAMTALTYVNLASNSLTGVLPEALGALTGLTLLNLEQNALRGSIPSSMAALTALRYLGLQGNKLSGPVPNELGALTALQEATLRDNALSGFLPSSLGALTQLTYLWLDTNAFVGTIPGATLAQLTALTVLTLDSNGLTGTLPPELGKLPQLQRLSAALNFLNGSLPREMANLTSLQRLSLAGNAFTDAPPTEWAALGALTYLDLASNALAGAVPPAWAAGMGALRVLDLSGNAALGPAPGVLASLPSNPCDDASQAYDAVRGCVCAPGFSLAAGRDCTPCAPGTYSAVIGSAACALCPANTYSAAGGASCVPCPHGSLSAAGAAVLANCTCTYGAFAVATATAFRCAPCPVNAVCPGPDAPLAQEGYWHLPGDRSVFYACDEGVCEAETPASAAAGASNCATGRVGNVCAVCKDGWAQQDDECVPCAPSDAFDAWSAGSKAGAIIGAVLLLFTGSYLFFLRPLAPLGGGSGEEAPGRHSAVRHALLTHTSLLASVLDLVSEPATIVMESLQIVSSFQRSMHVNWPPIYFFVMTKVNIINFSFLRFPKTACATPGVSFYSELNGITLGVTGLLLWVVVLWLAGNAYARLRALPAETRSTFNAQVLAHSCVILNLVYAPVSEAVIAIFACRRLGDESWLFRSMETQCGTAEHRRYVKVGAFWVCLYVIGIPLLFLALLFRYRVPHTATRLRRTALLRTVIDLAWQRGIKQPEHVNTSLLTEENISDAHLDALFEGLHLERKARVSWRIAAALALARMRRWLLGAGAGGRHALAAADVHLEADDARTLESPADADDACTLESSALAAVAPLLTRADRLDVLQAWAHRNVHLSHYTWADVTGSVDDVRREGVACIDHLYVPYYPARWYFGLLQNIIKLVLTSLLLFIAPGTPAQIVAGMCISFAVLLWYLRLLPYAEKVARQIAYSAYLVIFLFFFLALLLKMDVPLTPNDTLFYGVFSGILVFNLFGFPVWAMLRAGRLKPHDAAHSHGGVADEHCEKQCDDEAGELHQANRRADELNRTSTKFTHTVFHQPMPSRAFARADALY